MNRGAWWATVHVVTKSQTQRVTQHAHTHTQVTDPRSHVGPSSIFQVSNSEERQGDSFSDCHLSGALGLDVFFMFRDFYD